MNTKILKKLGTRIKELRLDKNLTQEKLAEKINVHQTYIGKLEIGMCNPSFMLVYKLSKALDVNLYEFFKFDNK